MKTKLTVAALILASFIGFGFDDGCNQPQQQAQSATGVQQASTSINTDTSGHTVEQNQISKRLEQDNNPGAIKHLYIISAYSGQVILYSTVQGKVTSSGKRLTPTKVSYRYDTQLQSWQSGFPAYVGNQAVLTDEVIQDDGTYGSSVEYLYWFDSKGIFHQQYVTGGMILHVSSEPIAAKSVVINLEQR